MRKITQFDIFFVVAFCNFWGTCSSCMGHIVNFEFNGWVYNTKFTIIWYRDLHGWGSEGTDKGYINCRHTGWAGILRKIGYNVHVINVCTPINIYNFWKLKKGEWCKPPTLFESVNASVIDGGHRTGRMHCTNMGWS